MSSSRGTPDAKQPEHRPDAASTNQPSAATSGTPGGTPHGDPLVRGAIRGQGTAPSDLTPDTAPDLEWQRAEHISEASIVSSDKLKSTGSAGLARQQTETAEQREQSSRSGPAQKASSSRSQPIPPADPQSGGPPTPTAGTDPRATATRTKSIPSESTAPSGSIAAYPSGKANSKDDLASQLGFPSFLEFFEGSQPLSSEQNNVWYTTALPRNQWVLWNSQTLEYSRPLPTLEQAKQASNFTG